MSCSYKSIYSIHSSLLKFLRRASRRSIRSHLYLGSSLSYFFTSYQSSVFLPLPLILHLSISRERASKSHIWRDRRRSAVFPRRIAGESSEIRYSLSRGRRYLSYRGIRQDINQYVYASDGEGNGARATKRLERGGATTRGGGYPPVASPFKPLCALLLAKSPWAPQPRFALAKLSPWVV